MERSEGGREREGEREKVAGRRVEREINKPI
jgi:hypothetical protein